MTDSCVSRGPFVWRTRGVGAAAAVLLSAALAGAAPTPAPTQAPSAVGIEQSPAPAAAPVPFDVEAATRSYLDRLTPEQKHRSDAYFEGGYWLQLWDLVYGLAVAWILLNFGVSSRMRAPATRLARRPAIQTWLYGVQYVVALALMTYPYSVYKDFVREHQYKLATNTFGSWMRDVAVGLGVDVVLLPLFLMALYAVFRRAPRTWWVWGASLSVVFLAFAILIAPVYVDPLFNEYKPLANAAVKDEILTLARGSGIAVQNVYEFDASRQTNRVSGNVSGFLGTMRIRLNDNLLKRCTVPEIKSVMGHEIGHYVLNHVYELLLFFAVVLVSGFAFVRGAFDWTVRRIGRRWGISGIADVAGLPLLGALLSIYFFLLTPIINTAIRSNEAEADLYGLQSAREPDGFAEVALKLGEYRKLEPGPFEEWFFFDHPSGRSRIRMAMRWKAEHGPGPTR